MLCSIISPLQRPYLHVIVASLHVDVIVRLHLSQGSPEDVLHARTLMGLHGTPHGIQPCHRRGRSARSSMRSRSSFSGAYALLTILTSEGMQQGPLPGPVQGRYRGCLPRSRPRDVSVLAGGKGGGKRPPKVRLRSLSTMHGHAATFLTHVQETVAESPSSIPENSENATMFIVENPSQVGLSSGSLTPRWMDPSSRSSPG